MHPLDQENLAYENNLVHNDPHFRVSSLVRPSPPKPPSSAPRNLYQRRDGLWSKNRYSYDTIGRELACATHADGHSIMWVVLDPSDAFLIDPHGAVIHAPSAYAEARQYARFWGAP